MHELDGALFDLGDGLAAVRVPQHVLVGLDQREVHCGVLLAVIREAATFVTRVLPKLLSTALRVTNSESPIASQPMRIHSASDQ